MHSDRGSALGRVTCRRATSRLVRGDRDVFGLHGRSAEQRLAIDLLLDPEVGIVSLGGRAGTGKSALALCAGLEAVLEKQQHKKIMVFRPLYAVGGQDLGFLPGDAGEKMNPWAQAVFDTLGAIVSQNVLDEVVERGILEVLPLTHIRGRSLHDAFVIVDEAQSLERNVLLTVLSRIGQNSRVVLTHDVAQRDNLRVGRHDGVASVIETLKGHPLFAHVTLTRSRALGDRGPRDRAAGVERAGLAARSELVRETPSGFGGRAFRAADRGTRPPQRRRRSEWSTAVVGLADGGWPSHLASTHERFRRRRGDPASSRARLAPDSARSPRWAWGVPAACWLASSRRPSSAAT